MRIQVIGGGPAGLFFSILMKRKHGDHEITVTERNHEGDTFGWGVVFSDETLSNIHDADPESYDAITRRFVRWDAIDIHHHGDVFRSSGHGFVGIARRELLRVLLDRARSLGVKIQFGAEVEADEETLARNDLVVAADGIRSRARNRHTDAFKPSLDERRCHYIWLGTTLPLDAFTFFFEKTTHGIFQVHAYRFDDGTSTFIVECAPETFLAASLGDKSIEASVAFLEEVFAKQLGSHRLMARGTGWIRFVTVKNEHWYHRNLVLLGDAAHTAHFSIGSGTKLAMEDAISLANAWETHPNETARALEHYQTERRPMVERIQRAAQASLDWFEHTDRYWNLPVWQFAFSLLTRSRRIGLDNLARRDAAGAEQIRAAFARSVTPGVEKEKQPTPPPMFTPFRLRDLTLVNRVVVSPMCMYSARNGIPNDFHVVHLGARALGGAGLVMTEMTNVSAQGRITPGCTGLWNMHQVMAWTRIVDLVHSTTKSCIGIQLSHAGRKGATTAPWLGGGPLSETERWPTMAPSSLPYLPDWPAPREMNADDFERVCADFVCAAQNAEQAGFDLLELHMAHGYLLSSFISPLSNKRTDDYGGSLENRMRFPLEVFRQVRALWPAHKPMSVRLSATDWHPEGLTVDDAVVIATMLKNEGCDLIDVSSGMTSPACQPVYGRMFQLPFADRIRNEVGIATMAVGAILSADDVNTVVAAGRADLCALARVHLDDPHFSLHAAQSQGWEMQHWPDPYLPGRNVVRK